MDGPIIAVTRAKQETAAGGKREREEKGKYADEALAWLHKFKISSEPASEAARELDVFHRPAASSPQSLRGTLAAAPFAAPAQ